MPLHEHLTDLVARTQRVELRPTIEVLERIVRAVVGAPAHDTLEIAAVVKILAEELAACGTFSASSWRSSVAHRGAAIRESTRMDAVRRGGAIRAAVTLNAQVQNVTTTARVETVIF
jgi:hypothetical protein